MTLSSFLGWAPLTVLVEHSTFSDNFTKPWGANRLPLFHSICKLAWITSPCRALFISIQPWHIALGWTPNGQWSKYSWQRSNSKTTAIQPKWKKNSFSLELMWFRVKRLSGNLICPSFWLKQRMANIRDNGSNKPMCQEANRIKSKGGWQRKSNRNGGKYRDPSRDYHNL